MPLLQEGVDTQELGLTKTRSTPQDWAQRGNNRTERGLELLRIAQGITQ